MPRYFAIDAGVHFDASLSDLLRVDWQINSLSADFALPGQEEKCLRVNFDNQTIVRLLDEMPLSTETEPEERSGLVPHHFAYRVEGARFTEIQSEVWKEVAGPINHYQFVTGWGCMDVLCRAPPSFSVFKMGNRATSAMGS